ncbi:DNA-binding transcriptional regulator, MarR family [Gracilibacillus ureilyticus]|uniref:DNA-binding transcriptional regulator, MarR family n=1 Tax=Gracilibacillus ureilyticus TaxID=531814 RepID=A0A1H9NCN4_9BACI|nr:MarR family transcriptional regulator [Gracilibacillus ureilyticus]SER33571.1 DNA-binding transcriptional regulator, MarR family [Gracilibacillus ureilyticus]
MEQHSFFENFIAFTASVHRVTHELTIDCIPDNITPVQYSIMELIAVSDPLTLSQISDCLRISLPNASREVRKLNEKKLLKKTGDLNDRRKQYIQLSQQGEKIMSGIFECIKERLQKRLNGISEEELKQGERAMSVLMDNVFAEDN